MQRIEGDFWPSVSQQTVNLAMWAWYNSKNAESTLLRLVDSQTSKVDVDPQSFVSYPA